MTSIYKIQIKHLNEHSTLYGGQLLEWIDNYCFAKSESYKHNTSEVMVTKNIQCEFIKPALLGEIVKLKIIKETVGNTSVKFNFEVNTTTKKIAQGDITFVKLLDGKKASIKC